MVKAPTMGPSGATQGIRKIHPGPEIAMNPRNLPTANAATPPSIRTDGKATTVYLPQVDVSTQVDLHGSFGPPAGSISIDWDRRATPLYSREDIKEQYCITSRQLDAVEKSGGGFFGCLSTKGPSPCSSARTSILSACVRSVPSDENICDAPYPRRPLQIMYRQPYPTYSRGLTRYDFEDEAGWVESSYFRRRPRSFCTVPDPKWYTWLPEDEESSKLEGPRPVLPPAPPPPTTQAPKTKHVSFARSHTLTSFDVPRSRSPPRPQNQERLIDSQPTMQNALLPLSLPLMHPYTTNEPRVIVLEKPPKRGAMKTQATQTEIPAVFRGRIPVTLSPRTIHRVKMVSQGAQTNGLFNGRRLTKSYSEAGQLGTPLGGQTSAPGKDETEHHEPLHRTQSEEPPRSPFLVTTPPPQGHSVEQPLTNGDISETITVISQHRRRSIDLDDQEILIDFKPAPVSPDARALLNRISQTTRRFLPLQKTLSDGEIRVERRELIGEAGEPSYPHTCRRNHEDPWGRAVRAPVQFSSTPEDLSLLRVATPQEDHLEEEFHENLIRRGLFRKRSVSLEDGVQGLAADDFTLPRSLPTSPTSPTAVSAPRRLLQSPKDYASPTRLLRQVGQICPIVFSSGIGISSMITSPFASSDSLTNDATRDHSDGIWNESQATVLQADSLALLTPSSKRRHLLFLQHQQRSSMDTEALDIEETLESRPSSPRIRLEPATPIQPLTPRQLLLSVESVSVTVTPLNGRPRGPFRRPSPGPSQPQSQSSSEFGLSLARTDSGGRTNTDLSETSTTEDYVTANTSTETGTTTGTSATTSSWSRPPQTSSAAASASATATAAEGSSFESASSIYSLARSEAVVEEPCSPPPILEETEIPFGLEATPPSPARSTSSSSSGSYDLKDAMTDPGQEHEQQTAPPSGHTSDAELECDEGHRSSSGGYAESPPDLRGWTEEERRRRRKTFTLDFLGSTTDIERTAEMYAENAEVSPTPSHRQRPRGKSVGARSPHRNNRKRETVQQTVQVQQPQQQQITRSPQKEDWRVEQTEEGGHVPTSDDSSCSHHYHMHHHHHHHLHRDGVDGRHKRTRDSPRRKTTGYVSARRRSNEDKNAAITGSLPRRRSRAADDIVCSRLSPGRYQRSPAHNGQRAVIVESQSPEARLKALSAESLRSVSPGSDSVFYSEGADHCLAISAPETPHCHQCGREVSEEIVRPPAGFADSPEGHRTTSKHVSGHRLYKKFDKRYRSEDRGDRRHRRSSAGRSDVRAKSEERVASRRGSRGSIDESTFVRKRLHARSTDVSLEILTGREDEDTYVEPYTSSEWIYIGDLEEGRLWKRPESRDGDEEVPESIKERRSSQESTESERNFRKRYHATTQRILHRRISGEMFKRIQTKCFESDKRVVVRREAGGEFGFRIHGSKPVVVSAIEPDTPAESSGLEVGDILISVNGKSVMDATHSEVVRLAHSGTDVLELEVARTCNVLAPRVARPGVKEGSDEAPLYSGYLWRKSTTSSSTDKWVRRWFALRRDNCLYYYKTDADSQPVGAVMLIKYNVEQTPELRLHSFAIKKQGAPTLRLAADTEEVTTRWTTVIKEAIERNDQVDTWLEASLRMREMAACTIQKPDCFGYLSKQQEHARKTSSPTGWSRRYCVLKDAALYFYDDANAERAFGVACLHGFRVHYCAPTSGGRKHAFELQPPDPTQRNYIFATDSEMDKKRWIAALEYSIDRWIKIG